MLVWLVLRFLLRVNLDQNLVLSGAVLAHGLRRGEVQPADITRHPLFPNGGRDGAEGACPGCGKGSQLFTDPLPIPDHRWCISYVGLSGSKLLQLATGRSMEIIDWVLDTILFSESGVADVIDVSRLIRDGPQLSVKPLAERDRPRGREANGVNAEQSTGDRAGLPYPNAVSEAQEPPSLHRALDFSLSVPSLSQPVLHHSFAPPL